MLDGVARLLRFVVCKRSCIPKKYLRTGVPQDSRFFFTSDAGRMGYRRQLNSFVSPEVE